MNYLETCLALDGAMLDLMNRDQAEAGGPAQLTASDIRLLEALAGGVDYASVFIVVSSSVANALVQPDAPPIRRTALTTFLPPDLGLQQAAVTQLINSDIDLSVVGLLQLYSARLTLAKRLSEAHVEEGNSGDGPQSTDSEILADAWRNTCESALHLQSALSDALAAGGVNRPQTQGGRIAKMLYQAHNGRFPCVEPDGKVMVPGWAERRRAARLTASVRVEVHHAGQVHNAIISNVSASGLALKELTGVPSGALIAIKLPDGRKLQGVIVWAASNKAGVRLAAALANDDPLLGRHGAKAKISA